jgi:Holliday junction resolvasome RuvABC endonuclease subunit|tara:strand:- start:1084 stop:1563 length:480 start_codon:yes stop_codon:yes gene_type:complete
MKYIGLDTSSKAIHIVELDEDENLIKIYKADCNTKKSFKDRFPELMDNFARILVEEINIDTVNYAVIEEPIFAQNRNVVRTLSEVVGAVWGTLCLSDIPTALVDNGTWKKHILGSGKATKDDILKYAIEKWGDEFPEQDYADAACIALYSVKENRNGST